MEQMIHKSFAKLTAWKGSKPPLCFRRKLFYLQKELLKERTRNTTLEEQLKPVNIHRWRLLEVTQLVFVQLSKAFFSGPYGRLLAVKKHGKPLAS